MTIFEGIKGRIEKWRRKKEKKAKLAELSAKERAIRFEVSRVFAQKMSTQRVVITGNLKSKLEEIESEINNISSADANLLA